MASESSVHFLRQGRVFPRWLAWLAIGFAPVLAAEEVRAGAREDRSLPVLLIPFNKLANSSFESGATTENLPLPQWLAISGATRGAPIVITTPVPHGLANDDRVVIKGVQGNPGANGAWTVQPTGPTTFLLEGSVGTGLYAGGGAAFPARGQPAPPGAANERGELPWTPWFSVPAAIPATEFFRSNGAQRTGEVSTFIALPPGNAFLAQEIDGSLFEPGEPLCLSIEARVVNSVTSRQNLTLIATAAFATVRVHRVTFPASAIRGEYQRFAMCFALDPAPIPEGSVLRVQFINQMVGGEPQPMFWARPMLNEGTSPVPWTPAIEPMTRTRAFY